MRGLRFCLALVTLVALSCGDVAAQKFIVTDTIFDRKAHEETFAFGADISWLSQQESWNTVYRNRAGQKADLMDILMDEQGMNALRFRVWVNPSGGWSGKQDVIGLCRRAHAKGYDIMIDFHYSDTWADPGSQTIPAQWEGHSVDQLAQDIYDHTYDILSSLKKIGIIPKWVQIGNETKRGMLYDVGKTSSTQGHVNFAKFVNSGYKAIKDVDESIQAIVHLPDGHDNGLYRNMFDNLKKNGAKWDIIGMSAYPRWSHLEPAEEIRQVIANVKDMKSRYGTPVMIVETGHYNNRPIESNHFLVDFFDALIKNGVLGAFYWEPEAMSGYELGAWDPDTHQASLALDAYLGLKHFELTHYMNVNLLLPNRFKIYGAEDVISYRVTATHEHGVVKKVDFYANDSLLHTAESSPYTHKASNLKPGVNHLYAVATDTHGHTQNSDTLSVIVEPGLLVQEGDACIVGQENEWSVASTAQGYTGEGYIDYETSGKKPLSFVAKIPASGTYNFVCRYSAAGRSMFRICINGERKHILILTPTSAPSKWNIVEREFEIEEVGEVVVTLEPLSVASLPNIDLLALFSPDGCMAVEPGDATSLSDIVVDGIGDGEAQVDVHISEAMLSVCSSAQINTVEVFDVGGRKLFAMKAEKSFNCDVPLEQLSNGTYILRIVTSEGTFCEKVAVSNRND